MPQGPYQVVPDDDFLGVPTCDQFVPVQIDTPDDAQVLLQAVEQLTCRGKHSYL